MKVNRRFGGICLLHLQCRRTNQARNLHEAGIKESQIHGVISQKTEPFITDDVRTADPTFLHGLCSLVIYETLQLCRVSLDSAVGIATGYGLDERGVGVRVPVGSRIFFASFRPALGSTQSPIQWIRWGALSLG
jgi:hypothetical protein